MKRYDSILKMGEKYAYIDLLILYSKDTINGKNYYRAFETEVLLSKIIVLLMIRRILWNLLSKNYFTEYKINDIIQRNFLNKL